MRRLLLACLLCLLVVSAALADWSNEVITAIVDSCGPQFHTHFREVYLLCTGNGATTVTVSSPALAAGDIVFDLEAPFDSETIFLERETYDQSSYVIEEKNTVFSGRTFNISADRSPIACYWVYSKVSDANAGFDEAMVEIMSKDGGGGQSFNVIGFDTSMYPMDNTLSFYIVINQEDHGINVDYTSKGGPVQTRFLGPGDVLSAHTYPACEGDVADTVLSPDGAVTVVMGTLGQQTFRVPVTGVNGDGTADALAPISDWGKKYYTVPYPVEAEPAEKAYIAKIQSVENGNVSVSWDTGSDSLPVTANCPALLNEDVPTAAYPPSYSSPGVFEATVPIQLMQILRSPPGSGTQFRYYGDASTDMLPPAEELPNRGNACIVMAPNFDHPYTPGKRLSTFGLALVAEIGSNTTIDDGSGEQAIAGWQNFPDGSAQYARVSIQSNINYKVKSTGGIFCRLTGMTGPTGIGAPYVGGYSSNVPSFWEIPPGCPESTPLLTPFVRATHIPLSFISREARFRSKPRGTTTAGRRTEWTEPVIRGRHVCLRETGPFRRL